MFDFQFNTLVLHLLLTRNTVTIAQGKLSIYLLSFSLVRNASTPVVKTHPYAHTRHTYKHTHTYTYLCTRINGWTNVIETNSIFGIRNMCGCVFICMSVYNYRYALLIWINFIFIGRKFYGVCSKTFNSNLELKHPGKKSIKLKQLQLFPAKQGNVACENLLEELRFSFEV